MPVSKNRRKGQGGSVTHPGQGDSTAQRANQKLKQANRKAKKSRSGQFADKTTAAEPKDAD